MTKPKNRVYCLAIRRSKRLFETQAKAERFIKFNESDLRENGTVEFKKLRTYYCEVCGGWHITHALLSEEEAKKRDDQIKKIITLANEDIKREKKSDDNKIQDVYEFIRSFDLHEFGGKKKFKRYLMRNPEIIPHNIEQPKLFHIIKEIPIEYFTGEREFRTEEVELGDEKIQEMAQNLYSEMPLQNLTTSQLLEDYIKWEFIYKQNIPFIVIRKLYELCGLR